VNTAWRLFNACVQADGSGGNEDGYLIYSAEALNVPGYTNYREVAQLYSLIHANTDQDIACSCHACIVDQPQLDHRMFIFLLAPSVAL
jgi:hypothetical protein